MPNSSLGQFQKDFNRLHLIFSTVLAVGQFPSAWLETKAGKASRSISQRTFLLKTHDWLLGPHLRTTIKRVNSTAYRKGRFTKQALHTIVATIENSLCTEIDLLVPLLPFLDIVGAFNNDVPNVITEALTDLWVDSSLGKLFQIKDAHFQDGDVIIRGSDYFKTCQQRYPTGWRVDVDALRSVH